MITPAEAPVVEAAAAPVLESVNFSQVFAGENLFAVGGFCAPMVPIYEMDIVSKRPVKDALPSFTARRGETSASLPV